MMNWHPFQAHKLLLLCIAVAGKVSADSVDDNRVCPVAEWRKSSFFGKPVGSLDFRPDENPLNSPYYRGPVQKKLLPAAVLLVLTISLLAIFLIWRVVRLCCRCCCHCCCVRTSKDPSRLLTGQTNRFLKVLVLALSVGIIAGCALGMTKLGPHLVDEGLAVVDSLKAFAQRGFTLADMVVTDIHGIQSLLDEVEAVRTEDLDLPQLTVDINGLKDFLTLLINPSVVKQELTQLNTAVGIVAADVPQLALGVTSLTGATVPTVQGAATAIDRASTAFAAFKNAAQSVISSVAGMPATKAGFDLLGLKSALSALTPLTGAFSLASNVTAASASVDTIAGVRNDVGLTQTISSLQSIQQELGGFNVLLSGIASQIGDVNSQYQTARVHMQALLDATAHINSSIVVLPQTVQDSIVVLSDIKEALDAYLLGSTPPTGLSLLLTSSAATVSSLQPSLTTTLSQLSSAQTQLASIPASPDPTRTALFQALSTATTAAETAISPCASLVLTFIPASATNGEYSALKTGCTSATGALAQLGTALDGALSGLSTASAAGTAFAAIPSQSVLQSKIAGLQSIITTIPALPSYISSLDPIISAYDALPANKASLFDSALSTLNAVDTNLQQGVSTAQGKITNILGDVTSKVTDIRGKTLDKVNEYQDKYLHQVRTYDRWRIIGEYAFFVVGIVLAVSCTMSALTACQFCASTSTLFLLLATLVYSLVGIILLVVAVIGNDGCQNAEQQILSRLGDVIKNDAANLAKITAVLRFYLFNEGGPLRSMVKTTFGVDLDNSLAEVRTLRNNAITDISGQYTLGPTIQSIVTNFTEVTDTLLSRVTTGEELLAYDSIHPIYLQVKTLICCNVLDMAGNLWLSLFIAASFAGVVALAMFFIIGRLDQLPDRRCCGCACRSSKEFNPKSKPGPGGVRKRSSKMGGLGLADERSIRDGEGLIKAAKLVKAARDDEMAVTPSSASGTPQAGDGQWESSSFSVQQRLLSKNDPAAKMKKTHKKDKT